MKSGFFEGENMQYLLLLLFVPLLVPIIAKYKWHSEITYHEMFLQIILICGGVVGLWYGGRGLQMLDHEVWNGQIVSKNRHHGQYTESYSCNCRRSGKTTTCSTCYRQHYTVTWSAKSTVGGITFDHKDWTTPAVYALPDPQVYKDCQIGEPASIEHSYMNYVKGADQSLFHKKSVTGPYAKMSLPVYPEVYGFYRYNRVINMGSKIEQPVLDQFNKDLNIELKTLGKEREVNIVVIVTEDDNPNLKYAVGDNWMDGKKNDVIVIVGLDGDKVTWADAMTWAGNHKNALFVVKLRDTLLDMKTFNPDHIRMATVNYIRTDYKRPEMKDFEYLLDRITPANWCMALILFLIVGGSIGLTVWFHRDDVNFFRGCGNFVDALTRKNRY